MEKILTLAGLALTAAFSFSLALLLGWTALTGLLRLLPARTARIENVKPMRVAARIPLAPARARRVRVEVAATRSRSGKIYTVRTA